MSSITFNGVADTTNGVITESISWFKKPKKRSNIVSIEGKDGATVTELGYEPLVIPAVIGLKSTASIDTVLAWLNGTGVLICSEDPLKYRNARILEDISYDKLVRFKKATVSFLIEDPYRYLITDPTVTKSSFPATLTHAGNVPSNPLLKITGSGSAILNINSIPIYINFDTSFIYVDCESKEAFYSSSLYTPPTSAPDYVSKNRNISLNQSATGERIWPTLVVGTNTISVFSGTITQVVITERTRFI